MENFTINNRYNTNYSPAIVSYTKAVTYEPLHKNKQFQYTKCMLKSIIPIEILQFRHDSKEIPAIKIRK